MTSITTPRLTIKPTHKNCWSIYDNLDQKMIGKLFFRKQWFNIILKPQSLRLGVATEASYGLMKAINSDHYNAQTALPHAQAFLQGMGFIKQGKFFSVSAKSLTCPNPYHHLNQSLGIDTSSLSYPLHTTAAQLMDSDIDCFNRSTKLHPKANKAWQSMKAAAANESIDLKLISAFRSLKYQAQLIQKKIDAGNQIDEILTTNTAPGHSEHHTGCAIDITTKDFKPLEESFELSPAFIWLTENASQFGFVMTYPKDNNHGIIYEPWHWCYHPTTQ